jgi:hypothetical protein
LRRARNPIRTSRRNGGASARSREEGSEFPANALTAR